MPEGIRKGLKARGGHFLSFLWYIFFVFLKNKDEIINNALNFLPLEKRLINVQITFAFLYASRSLQKL